MTRRAAPLMDARGGGAIADDDLQRLAAGLSQLQHHGRGQGRARGRGALPGHGARPAQHPRQRHLGRPVRTLAARSITGFTVMEEHAERNAPLRRNIAAEDVGNAALYLCSPLASNVTGHILLVDAGYNILGMPGVGLKPTTETAAQRELRSQCSSSRRSRRALRARARRRESLRTSGSGSGVLRSAACRAGLELQGVDDGFCAVVVVVEGVHLVRWRWPPRARPGRVLFAPRACTGSCSGPLIRRASTTGRSCGREIGSSRGRLVSGTWRMEVLKRGSSIITHATLCCSINGLSEGARSDSVHSR